MGSGVNGVEVKIVNGVKVPALSLFSVFDVIIWGLTVAIPQGFAIAATFTKQDPPVPVAAWIILWSAVLGLWLLAGIYFVMRFHFVRSVRAIVDPGIFIAWDKGYEVDLGSVQKEINSLLARMAYEFPDASKALMNCYVRFREPEWLQDVGPGFVARKVAGVQDGMLIEVGWRPHVSDTALQHELAHRVLQVLGGDPVESIAHARMESWGL